MDVSSPDKAALTTVFNYLRNKKLKVFDFDNYENNNFIAVQQLWVEGKSRRKRRRQRERRGNRRGRRGKKDERIKKSTRMLIINGRISNSGKKPIKVMIRPTMRNIKIIFTSCVFIYLEHIFIVRT